MLKGKKKARSVGKGGNLRHKPSAPKIARPWGNTLREKRYCHLEGGGTCCSGVEKKSSHTKTYSNKGKKRGSLRAWTSPVRCGKVHQSPPGKKNPWEKGCTGKKKNYEPALGAQGVEGGDRGPNWVRNLGRGIRGILAHTPGESRDFKKRVFKRCQ